MPADTYIPAIDESDKHAAYALYMGGFDADEIVARVGCNVNTLKAWITRDGWYRKREEINAARREKNPPEKSAIVKVFAPDKKEENVKIFKEKTGEIAKQDAIAWADMEPQERIVVAPAIAALNKMHRSNLDLDAETPGERGHISLTFLGNPDAVRLIETPPAKQIEDSDE